MGLEEGIVALEAENAALRERVAALAEQVQESHVRLAKDSHNSGEPPSSDAPERKARSLREIRGKKPGGRLGHRSVTLRLVAIFSTSPGCSVTPMSRRRKFT